MIIYNYPWKNVSARLTILRLTFERRTEIACSALFETITQILFTYYELYTYGPNVSHFQV